MVPDTVWRRDDMRAALADRDVRALFLLVRRHCGASQTRIGMACGAMPQSHVSAIMRGRRLVTDLGTFERIADGLATSRHADQVRDHWWWRPGWAVGRRFYTWHITFEDASEVHRLVRGYQSRLDVSGLDLVPVEWLHLTMQGVGFTDEVTEREAREIGDAARARCAWLAPFTLTLGPARVDPEAVMLQVTPEEQVRQLRATLREAIGDMWGPDKVPDLAEGFTPHVSIAYANTGGRAAPLIEAMDSATVPHAQVAVRAADLIVLDRDTHLYRWDTYATATLGAERA